MENNTGSSTEKFVKGLFVKMPNDKAPDFILLDMSFKPHEFFTWCQDRMDEKGWVNVQVKKSQKGTLYAELNTWKPKEQSQEAKEYNDTKYQPDMATTSTQKDAEQIFGKPLTEEEMPSLEDIPF